jgi:hypothetical protein
MRESRSSGSVGGLAGNRQGYPAADCFQRPLVPRSRFRPQLRPSVSLLALCGRTNSYSLLINISNACWLATSLFGDS